MCSWTMLKKHAFRFTEIQKTNLNHEEFELGFTSGSSAHSSSSLDYPATFLKPKSGKNVRTWWTFGVITSVGSLQWQMSQKWIFNGHFLNFQNWDILDRPIGVFLICIWPCSWKKNWVCWELLWEEQMRLKKKKKLVACCCWWMICWLLSVERRR